MRVLSREQLLGRPLKLFVSPTVVRSWEEPVGSTRAPATKEVRLGRYEGVRFKDVAS